MALDKDNCLGMSFCDKYTLCNQYFLKLKFTKQDRPSKLKKREKNVLKKSYFSRHESWIIPKSADFKTNYPAGGGF